MKENYLTDFQPINTESLELSILAAMADDEGRLADALGKVSSDMFSSPDRADAFKAMSEMHDRRESVSILTIMSKVSKEIMDGIIKASMTPLSHMELLQICGDLKLASIKRNAYVAALDLLRNSCNPVIPFPNLLENVEKISDAVKGGVIAGDGTVSLDEAVNNLADIVTERAKALEAGKKVFVSTGVDTLDTMLGGGLYPGNLVILAARPSVGKTAVMLQMAKAAKNDGFDALCLSLEMSSTDLAQRMLLSEGMLNQVMFTDRYMDWESYEKSAALLGGGHFWINDSVRSIDEITNLITGSVANGRCKAAYIDYLQLIDSASRARENASVVLGEYTRKLKLLAMANKIPVVLLSQLNRACANEKREPQLYDLRESGAIEQDADIVIMLDRPVETPALLKMYVRKNRQGPPNAEVTLKVDNFYTKFTAYDDQGVQAS